MRVLQRLPANRVDRWEGNRYLRVLPSGPGLALVTVDNRGTIDTPDVRVSVQAAGPGAAPSAELVPTVRAMLGLDVDPAPLLRAAARERALRPVARSLRGLRPPRFPDLFEAFANVLPFQQVSLEAGLAIVGRLVERFGRSLVLDGRRLHAFPAASAIAEARLPALRACGLSARKAEALRGLARAIASGELTAAEISALGTAEALGRLTALPGVGPWTAGLVLLRGLGRLDVFPPGDVGAARRLRAVLHLRPAARLDAVVQRFGPRRGYLYFLALGGSLLARGLIHAAPE